VLYLYLDESGDLGFDVVNRKGSKFFVISILAVSGKEQRDKIAAAVKRTLKNKLNNRKNKRRRVSELKGADTSFEVKQYFYNRIKDIDFKVYSLIIDKYSLAKTFFSSNFTKERLYNNASATLMEHIDFSLVGSSVNLVVDKCKNKKQIVEFNDSIRRLIEAKMNINVVLDIDHLSSEAEKCLGAADLFCYGMSRKYELHDSKWYEMFKDKIACEVFYK
jgi:hypothetical protein